MMATVAQPSPFFFFLQALQAATGGSAADKEAFRQSVVRKEEREKR